MREPVVSMLRELVDRAPAPEPPPAAAEAAIQEHCELCGVQIQPQHRHVLDLAKHELLCACRACQVLFDRDAAGGGHFRLVPELHRPLDDFRLDDFGWLALGLPVELAFFVRDSRSGRVAAFYPSPAGATQSELELESWAQIEQDNPDVAGMSADVEALLVRGTDSGRQGFLVGIDHCYRLVGIVRTHWRGFGGGDEVWRQIDLFFDELQTSR